MTKIFKLWRFVILTGIAKSGFWENTTIFKDSRVYILSMHFSCKGEHTALCFVIGPFLLTIGVAL